MGRRRLALWPVRAKEISGRATRAAGGELRQNVSISHEKIGDVLYSRGDMAGALAAYRTVLVIREELAANDPSNAVWQRDLSGCDERLGNVLFVQGDVAGAITSYRASLAIREPLAANDPTNAARQRDLAQGHERLGDALAAANDAAGAIAAYQAGLAVAARLPALRPDDPTGRALADALAAKVARANRRSSWLPR